MSTSDSQSDSTASQGLVFLLDVDNTLLDNDGLKNYFRSRILEIVGEKYTELFWATYEQVRADEDFVDYPETVRRFVDEYGSAIDVPTLTSLFHAPPFHSFVYAGVPETLAYLRSIGKPVILSDGDSVFQAQKIRESGLSAEVDDRVLIYVHKENQLSSVFSQYPAAHYVMVDDKARILAELSKACPAQFTTVHVLQGHYSNDGPFVPAPDVVIPHIEDLRTLSAEQFMHHVPSRNASTTLPT